MANIIIILLIAAMLGLALRSIIQCRRRNLCNCGCAGCASAEMCRVDKKDE